MNDTLFERDEPPKDNLPALSVSEISGAVKRVVEDRFGLVRVRGEIGRCSRPSSGHLYLALKDERAVIDGVIWKGAARRLTVQPEEGMEVVATGKLTTYPGSSKYQIVIDKLEPAGAGALMAMLEARRKALAAEGLFDTERKKALPALPETIGVITSPGGAVIRDILHRLADRFPRHVLIWPVAVQGNACAPEVSAAVKGFNAMKPGGKLPRPDLLIVARGGGSLEDLWGFNEEAVVRAVAESGIPVISAVGHETDVTLVDHAADLRAPTPTAAAEKAVPVRAEMVTRLTEQGLRATRAIERAIEGRKEVLRQTTRALPRPAMILGESRQRLDMNAERLRGGLRGAVSTKNERFARLRGRLSPSLLTGQIREAETRLRPLPHALRRAAGNRIEKQHNALRQLTRTLEALSYQRVLDRGYAVVRKQNEIITGAEDLPQGTDLTLEFRNKRHVNVVTKGDTPPPRRKSTASTPKKTGQGDLFGD